MICLFEFVSLNYQLVEGLIEYLPHRNYCLGNDMEDETVTRSFCSLLTKLMRLFITQLSCVQLG